MIGLVDYGAGNLGSVSRVMELLGATYRVVRDPSRMEGIDRFILPGVGSFGFIMDSLENTGLLGPLGEMVRGGTPYLGICLGMQILFRGSQESPGVAGLGLLEGEVLRFRVGKVPHMGWNHVRPMRNGLLPGYAYFANSYYVKPENRRDILALTDNRMSFVSAVSRDNILGVQFHPERSGPWGIDMIRRWVGC